MNNTLFEDIQKFLDRGGRSSNDIMEELYEAIQAEHPGLRFAVDHIEEWKPLMREALARTVKWEGREKSYLDELAVYIITSYGSVHNLASVNSVGRLLSLASFGALW